ncbi:MAG: hypothetical protein ACREMY_08740, partial [bacterium]
MTLLSACILLAQSNQCRDSRDDPNMLDLAPDVAESENGPDTEAVHTAFYSKEADQCARAFYDGDRKRGQVLWSKLLA